MPWYYKRGKRFAAIKPPLRTSINTKSYIRDNPGRRMIDQRYLTGSISFYPFHTESFISALKCIGHMHNLLILSIKVLFDQWISIVFLVIPVQVLSYKTQNDCSVESMYLWKMQSPLLRRACKPPSIGTILYNFIMIPIIHPPPPQPPPRD